MEIGHGRIICQFYHPLNLKRVLDGGPWTSGNHSLLVHQLKLGENPLSVPLNKILFYVEMDNIPAGLFTEKVDKMLGNFIDKFMEYDGSNKRSVWLNFMRLRVELNNDLPLKRWKYIKLTNGVSEH